MKKLSVDQALLKAKSHGKKGEIEEAQNLYRAVLQAFPNNKRAQKGLATLNKPKQSAKTQGLAQDTINQLINLYNQGQLVKAVEQAQALTEQYPDAYIIWNILGAAHKGLGSIFEASKAFKKVTELNPNYAEGFNNLGTVLKGQEKLEEAIDSFKIALALKPDYAEAYFNIGVTFGEQDKLQESIESYMKAVSLKPDHAGAYNNMGNALKDQGKLEEAITSFNKALAINPDYALAYNNMGTVLKDQGKLEEAIENYNKALTIKPDHAEAYNNMGNALEVQYRLKEAIDAYNKALDIKPDYFEAAKNLVKLPLGSIDEENIVKLKKKLATIPEKLDDQSQMLFFEAYLLSQKGEYNDAFKTFIDANHIRSQQVVSSIVESQKKYEISLERISTWSVDLVSEGRNTLKKLFILGPSRSGKSTLEKLLIGSPNVYPMLENINLNAIGEMKNSPKKFKKLSVKDLFYHDENNLFKLGYDVLTSTKPESMFNIDHLIDTFENVFCIYVKRNRIDIASEIFTNEYNEENFYSYNHSSISKYLDTYEAIWEILKQKAPQLTLEIPFEDILNKPQEVVDKINGLTGVSFQLDNIQNHSIKNYATPFREHYALRFMA